MIVFVSGGARSGKSQLAEALTLAAGGERCYYVATARQDDGEMSERAARHQARRDARWVTLEAPLYPDEAVASVPDGQAVLLDCLTLWASQLLFGPAFEPFEAEREGLRCLKKLLGDARTRGLHLVIVSNDLNEAPLPSDPGVWRFVTFLQRLHRLLAQQADSVIEVIAGCAIEWKADPDVHPHLDTTSRNSEESSP
ncbi:bifunctional adenosylcobinamide kinase/adenosylcobinamide-phosphate guanylyltransferase [Halomonas sp. GD1P12]|uniref:bifunctional adenosylcobinamide kinase/adenosylcobinamide-phosphate guanylyltransferase n=1 Tax=Halomonas sp. GD1P12 TaxID=2982691 RepID=UPI0021E4796C|nr:bifunctional adenosylcobinamide kinase/adenosylcobinamide-phosphate guanylyltransferase [Halomonas sp. GD1P12]UYG01233.1 bifunctional adenosylcobinamide kinase/adenosylcobinamide-phosphate guanylyltransferase [Halomonas sp. GD1P12]